MLAEERLFLLEQFAQERAVSTVLVWGGLCFAAWVFQTKEMFVLVALFTGCPIVSCLVVWCCCAPATAARRRHRQVEDYPYPVEFQAAAPTAPAEDPQPPI